MIIAIYGYGNLGRGVELAIRQNPDAELFGVFTRRDPKTVTTLTGAPVYAAQDVDNYIGQIDVMIICGGSASDLYDHLRRQRFRPAGDDSHAGEELQRGGFFRYPRPCTGTF